ncbi:E3 ubiquitin-protein ligase SIAH2 [Grus japonensis]|uniref:RING-type E3 ubiquitin transferase SIAH2 n=1 Tax=Grus japonensis TaxID=30415 RepID=A0ABC9X9Y2_GRUJA
MSRPSSAGPGANKPCGKQQHAPSPAVPAAVLPGSGGASPPLLLLLLPPPPPPPPPQQQQQQHHELTSLFECPVCFDYVLPPILQCQAGHLVCNQCRQKLSLCPTCRGSLTPSIRNLAMEKVASAVLFPCKKRKIQTRTTSADLDQPGLTTTANLTTTQPDNPFYLSACVRKKPTKKDKKNPCLSGNIICNNRLLSDTPSHRKARTRRHL